MGLGSSWNQLNFGSDLDHRLDAKKKIQILHLLVIICLDRGLCSLIALVSDILSGMLKI